LRSGECANARPANAENTPANANVLTAFASCSIVPLLRPSLHPCYSFQQGEGQTLFDTPADRATELVGLPGKSYAQRGPLKQKSPFMSSDNPGYGPHLEAEAKPGSANRRAHTPLPPETTPGHLAERTPNEHI
jgi:hypothetical protein